MAQGGRTGHLLAVAALFCLSPLSVPGCGDGAAPLPTDRVALEPIVEQRLTAEDLGRRWIALPAPSSYEAPHLARGPQGWLSVAREMVGGKAISAVHAYVYRSQDGVRWRKVAFDKGPVIHLGVRGLAYGNGRFLIVGSGGGGNAIWTSADGEQWSVTAPELGEANFLNKVIRVGGRFLAMTTRQTVLSSLDGTEWQAAQVENVPYDVTHGNGRYVVVGSGPILMSDDGTSWSAQALACTLPGACITDPSGGIHQNYHRDVAFAEGRFWTGQLSSADGQEWTAHADPSAEDQVGGYLFGASPTGTLEMPGLHAWRPGQPPVDLAVEYPASVRLAGGPAAAPEVIDIALPAGETCATHRCLMVSGRLYLLR